MTALAQLAYLRNGMEATHWHALKRLVRNELLVEYFAVGESACHTTSPLRALYELALDDARAAINGLDLPDGADRCYKSVRHIASNVLSEHRGLPRVARADAAVNDATSTALTSFLQDEAISAIVGEAVEYAIAVHQWNDAERANIALYGNSAEAISLPPQPQVVQWPRIQVETAKHD